MKAGSTAHSSGCLDDTNVSGSWRPDTGLHVMPHTLNTPEATQEDKQWLLRVCMLHPLNNKYYSGN